MSIGERSLRVLMVGGLAALMLVALGAQSALAEPATTCVKATKVDRHHTGGYSNSACTVISATHEGKYEKLADFTVPEEAQLKALLKYLNVESSGIDGKPTVRFSGANVQIVNGEGKTATTNGEGNLVIGYDEDSNSFGFRRGPGVQTGSHDLILGEEQEFTSYGGIVAGLINSITAPFASVSGGVENTASGESASVSGGGENIARSYLASVSGGLSNEATAAGASVSGGYENIASAGAASISGGQDNTAKGSFAWVGGGYKNEVFNNATSGEEGLYAAIFGGKENKLAVNYGVLP